MKISITRQFSKDAEKELNKEMRSQLADIIELLIKAESLKDILNVKKMKGFKTAYRIKMGDFRIGFIIEDDIIKLSRVLNRKEVYRFFPK